MAKMTYVGEIRKALENIVADSVSKRKDGTIVIRRGFFYRHGKDAEDFFLTVCKHLNKTDIKYSVKDWGEHWAAFKGGASISKQSHWYVELWPEQVDILA